MNTHTHKPTHFAAVGFPDGKLYRCENCAAQPPSCLYERGGMQVLDDDDDAAGLVTHPIMDDNIIGVVVVVPVQFAASVGRNDFVRRMGM